MNKYFKLTLLVVPFIVACSNNKTSTSESSSSKINSNSSSIVSDSSSSASSLEETYTLEYSFENNNSAVQISTGNHINLLKEMLKIDSGDVSDVSVNEKVYFDQGGLKFGSSKAEGEMIVTFNKKISKVEVEASCFYSDYNKLYDDAKILLNDTPYEVKTGEGHSFATLDNLTNTSTLKIANEIIEGSSTASNRLIVHRLKVWLIK